MCPLYHRGVGARPKFFFVFLQEQTANCPGKRMTRQLATALVAATLVLGAGAWSSTGTRNLNKDDIHLRQAEQGLGGASRQAPRQRRNWRPTGPISTQPDQPALPVRPGGGGLGGGGGGWVGGGFVLPDGGYERPVAHTCACPSVDMNDGEMGATVICSGHGTCNMTWYVHTCICCLRLQVFCNDSRA